MTMDPGMLRSGNILNELLPNLPGSGRPGHSKKSQRQQRPSHVNGGKPHQPETLQVKVDKKKKNKKRKSDAVNNNVSEELRRVAEAARSGRGKTPPILQKPQFVVEDGKPKPGKAERALKKDKNDDSSDADAAKLDGAGRDLRPSGKPFKQRKRRLTGKQEATDGISSNQSPTQSQDPITSARQSPVANALTNEESPRPRDSPSRYDFRKLGPSPPLISENADNKGRLLADNIGYNDLTVVEWTRSPNIGVKKVTDPAISNSPLIGGNWNNDAKEVKAHNVGDLSPPSSSSTLSSTNLQHLLSDVTESGSKLGQQTQFKIPQLFRHKDANFAPVDVTKNGRYVFSASQANNRVEVFSLDGKSAGKLRVEDRKFFDKPRNVMHIPKCDSMKDEPQISPLLNAGCVVVLDDQGFHVFSENGQYLGTILDGCGKSYRGLAFHRRIDGNDEHLFLVTIDISFSDSVHLALIDLREALKSSINSLKVDRIKVASEPDELLKCRFVIASSPGNEEINFSSFAYISALKKAQVFKVDLKTRESTVMHMKQNADSVNSTFASGSTKEDTFVDNMVAFNLKEPTGVALDNEGNLLLADRSANNIHLFTPNGYHVKSLFGKNELNAPIGIHYDSKERQVYVANNKSQTVISFAI